MSTSITDNLKALRERIENTFQSEVRAAEQKRKRGLESLVFLNENYSRTPRELLDEPASTPVLSTDSKHSAEPSPSTLKAAINEGIHSLVEFTKTDVVEYIAARYPNLRAVDRGDSIASMISRMNGTLIQKHKVGSGREQHVYRLLAAHGGGNGKGGEE